jgi:16S rRNA (adenine1518-N6/adenine1519-N6)-dimethyltransferase
MEPPPTFPDLTDPRQIRELLRRHGIRGGRPRGQHFLVDRSVLHRIVEAARLQPGDTVLEIGAGFGVLTQRLAAVAGRVIAVEVDERLFGVLQELFGMAPNVTLVHADARTLDLSPYVGDRAYKMVSNLPYSVASPLVMRLLSTPPRPVEMVVMVQLEVAQRMVGAPGSMSFLTVFVQLHARAQLLFRVPPRAFVPPPEVESAVVRLVPYPEPLAQGEHLARLLRIVNAGFAEKRKQLHNALRGRLGLAPETVQHALAAAGIDPARRAETLSLDEWLRLEQALAPYVPSKATSYLPYETQPEALMSLPPGRSRPRQPHPRR